MKTVVRIEKNRNYTVMSNYHLRDKTISLKAKGLLSIMLSLPDGWNFSNKGLAGIVKEGVSSVGTGLRELEAAKYIKREQKRNAQGQISHMEYIIYEQPYSDDTEETSDEQTDTQNSDFFAFEMPSIYGNTVYRK